MLDLNNTPPQSARDGSTVDVEALSDALAETAERWVPELFRFGRIKDGQMRCADIGGSPPRNQGSCVIHLRGDNAGGWFDYSTKQGGGPLSTIKEHLGCSNVIEEALKILESVGGSLERRLNRRREAPRSSDSDKNKAEAAFTLNKMRPIHGTIGETYLHNRGIAVIPRCEDLGFSDDIANFKTHRAQDAIIARFRYPTGEPSGGVHRLYLQPDGSAHDGKKMLGPVDGAVVMLGPPDDRGRLGVSEGIETCLAAMQMYDAPGWAAASDGGMKKLASWMLANPDAAVALGIRVLLVWADAGKAGLTAGNELVAAARQVGIDAYLFIPSGGDDFADDLKRGLPRATPVTEPGVEPEILPPTAEHRSANPPPAISPEMAARNLAEDSSGGAINEAIRGVLVSRLDKVEEIRALDAIQAAIGWKSRKAEFKAVVKKVQNLVEFGGPKPWANELRTFKGENGEAKPIMLNAAIVLQSAPECDGVLAFNEFAGMLWVRRVPPWDRGAPVGSPCDRPWTDEDEGNCVYWIQGRGDFHAPKQVIFEAVDYVARQHKFHPVRDWFETLPLDDAPFEPFEFWPTYYLGVDDTPYSRAVGAKWLISVVARVLRPGCKSDCALILEGDQGIGKSTTFRTLAGEEWFTDSIVDLADKDTAMLTRGKLIVELAELDALGKSEVSRQKVYMSRTVDEFRPPYGRLPVKWPRQFSVCGTVNENQYLRDATGGRRFWPLVARQIDIDSLARDRDRLFAEAIRRYKAGARWFLDTTALVEMAKTEQAARYQQDAFEPLIEDWLASQPNMRTVSVGHVLLEALGIADRAKWTRSEQDRVGKVLRHLGWEFKRVRLTAGREAKVSWRFVRPTQQQGEIALLGVTEEPGSIEADDV